MKFYYFLFSFFLFVGMSFQVFAQDTCSIRAAEIIKPDTALLNIIKRHIAIMKKRGLENPFYTTIEIMPALTTEDGLSKEMLDSMYAVNDFSLTEHDWKAKKIYPPKYKALIRTYYFHSLNNWFILSNFDFLYENNIFYYQYQNWHFILYSYLPLKLPYTTEVKQIKLKFNKIPSVKKISNYDSFLLINNTTTFYFSGSFINPYEKHIVAIHTQDNLIKSCQQKKIHKVISVNTLDQFYPISTQPYSMTFYAEEIIKPDSALLNIIKNYILEIKKKGIKSPDNKIITMDIMSFTNLPKEMTDSIYRFNDFTLKEKDWSKMKKLPPKYMALLRTSYMTNEIDYKKARSVFYYKYKEWHIIISSKFLIKMPNVIHKRKITLYSNEDKHFVRISNTGEAYYFSCGFINVHKKIFPFQKKQYKIIEEKYKVVKFK